MVGTSRKREQGYSNPRSSRTSAEMLRPAIKNAQNQHGIRCYRESDASTTPVAHYTHTLHDVVTNCAALWKGRKAKTEVLNPGHERPRPFRTRDVMNIVA
ncbi:hypothetical protein DEV91_1187 [Phyllobacterium brassicacearum]|nr:hypothetical protein DEV91_1187 [Phyllobacterium brassicacearum]